MDLIIGAGISGLSYAAFTGNKYIVIEKTNEIGGYCKTIKQDGFTWDYSGHFFHFKNKDIRDFVLEKMKDQNILDIEKSTRIYYKGKYIDFPFQKNIHQLDKEEFIDCIYDLFAVKEKERIVSFKDWVIDEFGKAIADKFLIPYNEKLYACDLDDLDKDAMGRFFPRCNKEEIVQNFKNPDNSSYNSKFTYPEGGAIEYVNSINERVFQENIYFNEELIEIDMEKKIARTNIREIEYTNLISSIPFPSLLEKIKDYNPDLSSYSWNKVLVFNLGFDNKGNDKENHWVYFPDKNIRFYRIGYYDNIFNSNRMSLYVEIGFNKDEVIDVDRELKTVIRDLEKTGVKSREQNLISHKSIIMNPAYVHIDNFSQIEFNKHSKKLNSHGVFSIGRYGGWKYCSIEDNIIEAKNLTLSIG